MAHRVKTDIDLGQNSIINGRFEPVSSLPTESNFLGRQVSYRGQPFWWNGTKWISWSTNYWKNDSANADVYQYFTYYGGSLINELISKVGITSSRQFNIKFDDNTPISDDIFKDLNKLPSDIRYKFMFKPDYEEYYIDSSISCTIKIPRICLVNGIICNFVYVNNALIKTGQNTGDSYYEIKFTNYCVIDVINSRGSIFVTVNTDDDVAMSIQQSDVLANFINENNIEKSETLNKFSLHSLIIALINKLNQGGGGATGDFWSLTQANAEVSACEVTINNSNESIFPKVLATYGDYVHSRNIIVDLSNYSDASSYVFDLFGDISNVPINVRYSIFITGYNGSLKLDFPKQYLTNISSIHSPDGMSEERYTIAYSFATKIDFVKLSANAVWVDVSNKM